MDLIEMIERLKRVTYKRPDNCKDCQYCITTPAYRFEDKDYFCGLIDADSIEACVNYEVYKGIEPLNCPLPDNEEREESLQLLAWLEELQEYRKQKEVE